MTLRIAPFGVLVLLTVLMMFGRGDCQAFAVSSVLPESNQTGTLTIHKFMAQQYKNLKEGTGNVGDETHVPRDARTVAGVRFTIERLRVEPKTAPHPDSPRDTAFSALSGITDKDGVLVIPDLQKGFYLVTETPPQGTEALSEQFVVKIPVEEPGQLGYTWNWDVHVFPKNVSRATEQREVYPKTITIIKQSASDRSRLAGASFKIATSEKNARDSVFVRHEGNDIEVTTDANGLAQIEVTGAMTYYLVETRAPRGFVKLAEPISVSVDSSSTATSIDLTIPNEPISTFLGAQIPKTGDVLRVSAVLMCVGLLVIVISRKRASGQAV